VAEGNWLGWSFGAGRNRGAANRREARYTVTEIEIAGNVGDPADKGAVHRAVVRVYDKHGNQLAETSTMGTLGEITGQAEAIQGAGERSIADQAERARQAYRDRHQGGDGGTGDWGMHNA
jgi:hypothetical protein